MIGGKLRYNGLPFRAGALWLWLLVADTLAPVGAAAAAELRVGWATADVTPDLSGGRVVSARGLLTPRITGEVRTPLLSTVLALESVRADGQSYGAILVSGDIITSASSHADGSGVSLVNLLRSRLEGRLPGFDLRNLIFSATHTHNGPSWEDDLYSVSAPNMLSETEYREFMLRRTTDAVVKAWEGRQPGKMAWALTHAAVGYNRRVVYADGKAVMGGWRKNLRFEVIEAGDDHALELLYFWDAGDRLTGVVANVPCPSQVEIQDNVVSADFWGQVRLRMAATPDLAGARVLTHCGAAGDQWPYQQPRDKAEADMRARRNLTLSGEIARRIVSGMMEARPLARARMEAGPVFAHASATVEIPIQRLTPAQLEKLRRDVAQLEILPESNPIRFNLLMRARRGLDLQLAFDHQPRKFLVEIQALRLGDAVLTTNPFELYVDYGARIKARSPATLTMIAQLTNGVGSGGAYLPTARAIEAGGYSADPMYNNCPVGPEGGGMLVDRTVQLIEQMWKEPNR
ncbi:MAG: hypothetical protein HY736_16310 [Verrucomicrobia bacterium]|nr:hypothetical protein [Verrucomicrobiota bacterium]